MRRFRAQHRRLQVAELLVRYGGIVKRGVQARIARELGVSRKTICLDVKEIRRQADEARVCPVCGQAAGHALARIRLTHGPDGWQGRPDA
ncbi:MAG: hypothetical protein CL878_08810 [Dehalococcoidia bacterium]|nr:hypothetical protein [Dehalococcoidia bacterium]